MLRWLLMFIVFAVSSPQAFSEDVPKYALLIGVNEWKGMERTHSLKWAEKDAQDFGDLLKSGGYQVDVLLGEKATAKAILDKIQSIPKFGSSDGVVLVGFFCNGLEDLDAGKSYFLPSDTRTKEYIDSDGKKRFNNDGTALLVPDLENAISLSQVLEAFSLSKCGNRILISDACRDNPTRARGFRAGSDVTIPDHTAVLLSCSQGENSFESPEFQNGVFSHCLLNVLRNQAKLARSTAGTIADAVHKEVVQWFDSQSTHFRQHPTCIIHGIVDLKLAIP